MLRASVTGAACCLVPRRLVPLPQHLIPAIAPHGLSRRHGAPHSVHSCRTHAPVPPIATWPRIPNHTPKGPYTVNRGQQRHSPFRFSSRHCARARAASRNRTRRLVPARSSRHHTHSHRSSSSRDPSSPSFNSHLISLWRLRSDSKSTRTIRHDPRHPVVLASHKYEWSHDHHVDPGRHSPRHLAAARPRRPTEQVRDRA
jgi:hypothetical protein